MGKRLARGPDGAPAARKRQKVVHEAPTSEQIHASRQLQQLLSFTQDPVRARHGLQSFKLFLDELLGADDNAAATADPERHQILRDYLQATRPDDSEDAANPVFLPGIMQTWSYGAQTNNENLMSAVPIVLGLLLKLLGRSLDTVPIGLGICRTLLQKRQQDLIARNLSADKGKAFIISPTLRMLREVVSFDGGAVARPLFRARLSTLKSLARNMGIVHIGDDAEDPKRPSTRTHAVLFFLTALRYLHPEAKKELLSQRDIVAALTRDVKQDPPYLVRELLDGLRTHVLLDDKLPREAKAFLLTASTLSRLAALYQYRLDAVEEGGDSESLRPVAGIAHDFLMMACTNPSCGVLRQDSGFYPREVDPNASISLAELDDLGLEAVVWMNKYKQEVPVRNFTLANFLPSLRPWSGVKQSDLVTAIFRVAPELVAHYFLANKSFTFEPKLTATWIGYASFVFKTAALPLPDYFGHNGGYPQLPPPTSIVIDNILPPPVNQKALSRSLASQSNLIAFFATRILVVAIEKLDTAVKMHLDPSHANRTVWAEAARRLIDAFCQRSPGIQDMINAYRVIPESDVLHREAASRLLRLCYEVLPQVALMAKFDVSPFLETSLSRLSQSENQDPRDFVMGLKELENLLAMAGYSPGMRWFSGSGVGSDSQSLSPFTRLLKVCVEAPRGVALDTMREVLGFVAAEQQLVVPATAPDTDKTHPGLLALLEALQVLRRSQPDLAAQLWPFLDNCLTRCANAPVKYVERMQELARDAGLQETAAASPVALAMLEQLPFAAAKEKERPVLKALGRFLPLFLGLLVTAGESRTLLELVFSKMLEHLADSKGKLAKAGVPDGLRFEFNTWSGERQPAAEGRKHSTAVVASGLADQPADSVQVALNAEALEQALDLPDALAVDNSALVKWTTKTVDELIDEGYVTPLMSLLASEHASIRKEALVNILKAAARIKQSEHEEREQVWLLLSELAETARESGIDASPLPSHLVAFACHALPVLRDPLSPLYAKVNTFLTRGPVWSAGRLPLVDEVLGEDPGQPDAYYAQLSWLLGYLIDGLRAPRDLELLHRKRADKGPVMERLLAVGGGNPFLRQGLRAQVLGLVYRATKVDGGSTTLTTRFGIVNWLDERAAECRRRGDAEELAVCEGLKRRVWETCDGQRVKAWSRGGLDGRW
ncbi:hypothetical protein VTJ04DRAFT_4723 [Mycothermus thermophilus]|uniref:uncharacterized protein n=1 Tax=Humicola insolens TaxID=85995 RepID=UPI003742D078